MAIRIRIPATPMRAITTATSVAVAVRDSLAAFHSSPLASAGLVIVGATCGMAIASAGPSPLAVGCLVAATVFAEICRMSGVEDARLATEAARSTETTRRLAAQVAYLAAIDDAREETRRARATIEALRKERDDLRGCTDLATAVARSRLSLRGYRQSKRDDSQEHLVIAALAAEVEAKTAEVRRLRQANHTGHTDHTRHTGEGARQ